MITRLYVSFAFSLLHSYEEIFKGSEVLYADYLSPMHGAIRGTPSHDRIENRSNNKENRFEHK